MGATSQRTPLSRASTLSSLLYRTLNLRYSAAYTRASVLASLTYRTSAWRWYHAPARSWPARALRSSRNHRARWATTYGTAFAAWRRTCGSARRRARPCYANRRRHPHLRASSRCISDYPNRGSTGYRLWWPHAHRRYRACSTSSLFPSSRRCLGGGARSCYCRWGPTRSSSASRP